MTTAPRTGGEVDAFCNRCKLNLAHTILALVGTKIVRVRCNTCMGEHAYRGPQVQSAAQSFRAPRPSRAAAPKAEKAVQSFAARVEAKDPSRARRYSPKDAYQVEDLVDHPTFGLGIVSAVRGDKVDVAFKAFEKTLVHRRGLPAGTSDAPAPAGPSAPSPAAAAPSAPSPSAPGVVPGGDAPA